MAGIIEKEEQKREDTSMPDELHALSCRLVRTVRIFRPYLYVIFIVPERKRHRRLQDLRRTRKQ